QHALITAYVEQGASSAMARQLAVKQIQPPKLSAECEAVRSQPKAEPLPWDTTLQVDKSPKKQPKVAAKAPEPPPAAEASQAETPASATVLTKLQDKKMLAQWDCAADVDFVTISLNGFRRKLTGGEICNPYEDVVHEVPASARNFRLGYTIRSGRMF